MLDHVVRIGTSAEVWSTLKDSFARSSNEREHIFQSKLQSLKRDACSSLSNFLGNFKNYCDELVATGRPIEDLAKYFGVLLVQAGLIERRHRQIVEIGLSCSIAICPLIFG